MYLNVCILINKLKCGLFIIILDLKFVVSKYYTATHIKKYIYIYIYTEYLYNGHI